MRFHLAQAGRVEQRLAGSLVTDFHAHVVAFVRVVAMRRIRRRLARQRDSAENKPRGTLDAEAVVFAGGHLLPVHTAIMAENGEQRVARGQVFADHVGAVDRQWLLGLAQHQQSGSMVDLAVHEDDARDGRVADAACRLCFGEGLDLGKQIGGGVEQNPVDVIAGDGDGRLGSPAGFDAAFAQAVAIRAVTVPLRETSSRRGAQHPDFHCSQPAGTLTSRSATGNDESRS